MRSTAILLWLGSIGQSYQVLAAPPGTPQQGRSAVVLIGVTGSGKSETGNTLIGKINFKVSGSIKSETRELQAGETDFNSRRFVIVDTPGFFDSSLSAGDIETVLAQLSEVAGDRVDALVFVVPYGRFSEPQVRAYRLFRSTFGDEGLRYVTLAFTQCGMRTEAEVKEELGELCHDEPDSIVCGITQEVGWDRIVTIGKLDNERRARDRATLFKIVENQISKNEGRPYDHMAFTRARAHRESLQRRINAVTNEAQRRLLEVMLSETKTGGRGLDELHRALEEAEGRGLSSSKWVHLDFEDGTLGSFFVVNGDLRRPMPIQYRQLKNFQCPSGEGGEKLLHTGTDSGVKLRNGESRQVVFRTETFKLGRGEVLWDAAGNGGYVAICRVDGDCVSKRSGIESTVMKRFIFFEDDLVDFTGSDVYIDIVDDRTKGWGFIAVDNLRYPKVVTPSQSASSEVRVESDSTSSPVSGMATTTTSTITSTPKNAAQQNNAPARQTSALDGRNTPDSSVQPPAAAPVQPPAPPPVQPQVQRTSSSALDDLLPPSPPLPPVDSKASVLPAEDEMLPAPAPPLPPHDNDELPAPAPPLPPQKH